MDSEPRQNGSDGLESPDRCPNDPTSPTGWWMAGLLERHERPGGLVYWNNYRLIHALHWRDAFAKACTFGRAASAAGREAFGGDQAFIGLTDLVPIYEPFEDGAEMLWQEFPASPDCSAPTPPDTLSEAELAEIYEPKSLSPARASAPASTAF